MLIAKFTRKLLPVTAMIFGAAVGSALAAPATTTQLSLSSTSVKQGATVTLRAAVAAGSTPVTQGQVLFCETTHVTLCTPAGANVLAVAQITPAGTASRVLRLGIGAHTIVARFVGTTSDAPSSSGAATLTVQPASGRAVTQVSLTATPVNSEQQPGLYNLSATVTTPGGGVPATGAVTFSAASPYTTTVLGTPALTTAGQPLTGFGAAPSSPAGLGNPVVADWNEDGIPDLAVVETTGFALAVLPGAGDGTFPAPSASNALSGLCVTNGCMAVATADFNGDGHADLVTLSPSGTGYALQFAYGKGNGAFTLGAPVEVTLATGLSSPQLVVGDYNGDGQPDLVVNGTVSSGASFAVALQQADHSFAITYPTSFGSAGVTPPAALRAADVNSDGKTDLVGLNNKGIVTFTSNGDGTFTGKVAGSAEGSPYLFALGDFNADGFVDVVVFTQPNNVSLGTPLFNDGHGSFTAGGTIAVDFPPQTGLLAVDAVDVNGDGIADLLLVQSDDTRGGGSGPLTIFGILFTADGKGGFIESDSNLPPEYVNALVSGPAVVGDLNGDGLLDLVYPQQTGCCTVLLNESGAGSSSASLTNVQMPAGSSLSLTAAYGGDTRYLPANSPATTVSGTPVSTTLQVSASPSTAVAGQAVTLTATLSPFAAAGYSTDGETVTFSIGNGTYGSYPTATLKSGVAKLTVSNLPLGNNLIFANYNGDGTFTSSSSSEITVVVNQATPPAAALKGTYVFRVTGTLPKLNGKPEAIAAVGVFAADGAGNIVSGEEDLNSASLTLTASGLQGSYNIDAAGTGTLHLVTGSGLVEDFLVVLASRDASGVAQKLTLLSTGSSGDVSVGEAVMQQTGLPLAGGGYTLGLRGETACQSAGCSTLKHGAGDVSLVASLIVAPGSGSGPAAENLAGTLTIYPNLSLVLLQEDSLERVTLTLNSPNSPADQPVNYAGYLTSGGAMYLLSVDPHSSKILLSGTLVQQ